MGDLLENIIDYRGKTPKKLGMDWGGNIRALSALNVKMGFIDYDVDPHYGSEELYDVWMKDRVRKYDILFTMEAPLGNTALLPDNNKYILSQRVVALQTKPLLQSIYLYQIIKSPRFQRTLELKSTGTTAKGISQKSLKKIPITLPVKEEQEKIAGFLGVVDERIGLLSREVEDTRAYKQGLLQQLFSGSLRFTREDGSAYPDWEEVNGNELFETVTNKDHNSDLPILAITQY